MDSSSQNNPSNNPPQNTQHKKGKGRKKTSTRRIENETRRQVTFSKRRSGLFKKANEIGTLCGAENAVVVDSPSGKLHSFGCPNVETVARRYLNRTNVPPRPAENAHDQRMLAAYNEELANLERQLEWEKKYKKESKRMIKEMQAQEGIPHNPDKLDYQQLDELLKSALSLKQELENMKQDGTRSGYPHARDSTDQNVSYPLNRIAEGPSYMARLGPGGYSNYPNRFDIGYGSNNSNAGVSPNNSGANNPNATFLTANANPGFVEPVNRIMASNLGLPFQYPTPSASGSNPMFPFYYGNQPSAEARRGRRSSNGRGHGNKSV